MSGQDGTELQELRDEVARLSAEVTRLGAELNRREGRLDGPQGRDVVSRRALLRRAALAAAAGVGAGAIGSRASARAADGSSLVLGSSSAAGGTANTAESPTEVSFDGATPPQTVFLVNDTRYAADQPRYYSSVLAGWAGRHDQLNVGLYGLSEAQTNPIGLVGRGYNLDPDLPAGIGVEGYGVTGVHAVGTGYGVHAEGGQAPLLLQPGGTVGPPTTGTFAIGSVYADADGTLYVRKTSGTGAAWVRLGFTPLTPARVYDSRSTTPVSATAPRLVPVAGRAGVPAFPAAASAALAVTIISPTRAGYATVWPSGSSRPVVSNVNYGASEIRNASVPAKLGPDGAVLIAPSAGTMHVAVDVLGYFS
jgi:hypothetical protein